MPRNPFAGNSVWTLLEQRAATTGSRPFLTWQPFAGPPSSWTYSDLAREASAVAAGMQQRGVRHGDRILIHLDNSPEFVIAWFACAAIGAVAVTTNTRSAADEVAYFAEHAEPVGAITQPRLIDIVSAHAPGLSWLVSTAHDAGVPSGAAVDVEQRWDALAADPGRLDEAPPDADAPLSVQYTSGTTDRPKGVVWTHANGLWGARVNAAHEALRPDDCHLVYMPLFHANAIAYSLLATLWVGARLVLIPKWTSSRFWDVSMQHRCTWLSLIRPSINVLATAPVPDDQPYRMFGTGLCDLRWPPALAHVKTIGWWGMTETISHGVVGDPYTPNRPMSMGRPAPEYGISVVDAVGAPVEPGATGELLVKGVAGVSLFAAYLHDEHATAAAFDDNGWFHTGDLVTVHDDGHLSFADRAKDMLKVGAENVAASEIERVIGGVDGVDEVAVVGRRDERLDQVPVAFVVPAGEFGDLDARVMNACRTLLADFKVPHEVVVVRELPRSTLRKVNKGELRAVAELDAPDRAGAERQWLAAAQADPSGDAGPGALRSNPPPATPEEPV